ncbi:MAG TPA: manganese efflux pump MntP family protein [Thermoanaerobaculia bacterium]|nr:manganese efflux pump MntP family protein [Thermoanaerobaculia bacterium]
MAIAGAVRGATLRRGLVLASAFGIAQSLMAAIGWLGGATLGGLWAAWDHWIALILLSGVGTKMIKEAFGDGDERQRSDGIGAVVVLAVATSIDALAVGVSLPALGTPLVLSLAMIGLVTLLFSAAGAAFGRFLGERFGRGMEVAGGLALIAIGIGIVIEHT